MTTQFLGIPDYQDNHKILLRKMIVVLKGVMQGKTNNTGTFTLNANTSTTTITLAAGRIGTTTVLLFEPTTANAATEFGAGTIYRSATDTVNNTFTITHANNANADRTFNFVLIG